MKKKERGELNFTVAQKFMLLDAFVHMFFRKNRRKIGNFGNRFEGQGQILSILEQNPVISQKELNKQVRMRPQSVSEMIKKLTDKEYIKRYPSDHDRRVMMIELTDAGRELLKNGLSTETFSPIILDILTDEEIKQFGTILDKLNDGMVDRLELDSRELERITSARRMRRGI